MKRLFSILLVSLLVLPATGFSSCLDDYRREIKSKIGYGDATLEELKEVASEYHMKKKSSRKERRSRLPSSLFGSNTKSLIKAYIVLIDSHDQFGPNLKEATKDVSEDLGFDKSEATVQAYIMALDDIRAFCPDDGELLTYEEMVKLTSAQM